MKAISKELKEQYVLSTSKKILHLTLMPTEKCNFRCVYCYEDFEIGKMDDDTITGIKNFLEKSAPGLKSLHISWFGGEPTLAEGVIIEISTFILELQEKYNFNYSASMTTNAFILDKEKLSNFLSVGCTHYQISLDGDRDEHNKTRVLANGKESFDVIYNNLLSYKKIDHDFSILLRLHVTDKNLNSMSRLCEKIKDDFFDDKRYKILVKGISNLGDGVGNSVKEYVPKDKQEASNRIESIYQYFNGGRDNKEKSENDEKISICYAAKPNHLLFRADGRLGKCTVMFNDNRNDIGRISKDGSIQVNGKKLDLWTRGFLSFDRDEFHCPAKNLPKYEEESNKSLIPSVSVA